MSWISSIFDDLSSWQVTIISNSPLVYLLLLRLNRIAVPFLMRFFRARQRTWLDSVPSDVARELKDHPQKRIVCTGSCCAAPRDYKSISAKPNTMTSWLASLQDGEDRSQLNEEQMYYQMRVLQLEKHRMNRRAQLIFPDSLSRYFTLCSLVIYWVVLCTLVFSIFHFVAFDKLTYAGGLLLAGITAEWDSLFPLGSNTMPHWMTDAAKRFSIEHDQSDNLV